MGAGRARSTADRGPDRHSSGVGDSSSETQRRRIYVTGHRNPDLDSIASAIGYAELKARHDPDNDYVPVRLGSVNAQTAWALERSGADKPDLMRHVMLRVRDVMRESFPVAHHDEPVREVGLTMARDDLDIVPIVDDDGELVGVMTERALARRYIRESRKISTLVDAPTTSRRDRRACSTASWSRAATATVEGRVWVHSIDAAQQRQPDLGRRRRRRRQPPRRAAAVDRARRRAAGHRATASRPEPEVLELARERGAQRRGQPARLLRLEPHGHPRRALRALADREPLTVGLDDLMTDIAEEIKDVHYRAAVAVDALGSARSGCHPLRPRLPARRAG